MKKIFILALAILMVVGIGTGCSLLRQAAKVAPAVLEFIGVVDDQVNAWHENGWLPVSIYSDYERLREKVVTEWDAYRQEFIDFVAKFLAGEFIAPAASGMAPGLPDGTRIKAAAAGLHEKGLLTDGQVSMLR